MCIVVVLEVRSFSLGAGVVSSLTLENQRFDPAIGPENCQIGLVQSPTPLPLIKPARHILG